MLKQRIITALILLPLILVIFFVAPLIYFATAIAIVTYLIALEWAKLAGFNKPIQCSFYALAISAVNLLLWFCSDNSHFWPSLSWPQQLAWDYPMIALTASVVAIALIIFIVVTYTKLPKWWANISIRSIIGFAMLPAFFVALISIRNVNSMVDFYYGGQLILMMFCMIWAADIGAYFTGKAFGKHQLAPVVSPNKTWEGAAGGLVSSFIIAWLGVYLLHLDIHQPVLYSVVVILLAIISIFGDLFESALKRVVNIKDSGNLLPGHGGVLDRLDSSIVVAPLFYLVYSFYGWIN